MKFKELAVEFNNAGKQEAYAELYYAYKKAGIAKAMSVLKDMADAETAYSEALMKTVRAISQHARKGMLLEQYTGYFFRTLHNTCIDVWKDRKHLEEAFDFESPGTEERFLYYAFAGHMNNPEVIYMHNEFVMNRKRIIGKAVGKLPAEQAEVIELHYFKEISVEEIAGIQRCSVSTVKSRLRYGRDKLRQDLMELKYAS